MPVSGTTDEGWRVSLSVLGQQVGTQAAITVSLLAQRGKVTRARVSLPAAARAHTRASVHVHVQVSAFIDSVDQGFCEALTPLVFSNSEESSHD